MELDGDFIAPTGLRMSELDEATDDQIRARAVQIWRNNGEGAQDPKANWVQATQELEDEEELTSDRNKFSPTNPDNVEKMLGVQDHDAAVPQPPTTTTTATTPQPPTVTTPAPGVIHPGQTMLPDVEDDDTIPGADPQPPVVTPPGTDTQPTAVVTPPVTPPQPGSDDADSMGIVDGEETGNVDGISLPGPDDETERDNSGYVPPPGKLDSQIDDIADPGQQTDSSDGGPDEFDEKNRPFTDYMDRLIKGETGPGAPADTDSQPTSATSTTSEGRRRLPSLAEAVFGSSRFEIVGGR